VSVDVTIELRARCIELIRAQPCYRGHECFELMVIGGFPKSTGGSALYLVRSDLADLHDTTVYRTFVVNLDDRGQPESVAFFDSQRRIDGDNTIPPAPLLKVDDD